MELSIVTIQKPETLNFILGQSHFIKTVEDVHEALVNAVPGIKFGLAFCEASGACLMGGRFSCRSLCRGRKCASGWWKKSAASPVRNC